MCIRDSLQPLYGTILIDCRGNPAVLVSIKIVGNLIGINFYGDRLRSDIAGRRPHLDVYKRQSQDIPDAAPGLPFGWLLSGTHKMCIRDSYRTVNKDILWRG